MSVGSVPIVERRLGPEPFRGPRGPLEVAKIYLVSPTRRSRDRVGGG